MNKESLSLLRKLTVFINNDKNWSFQEKMRILETLYLLLLLWQLPTLRLFWWDQWWYYQMWLSLTLYNETYQHLEDLNNSTNISKWPRCNITKSHTWASDPLKIQDRTMDFNVTGDQKFMNTVSGSKVTQLKETIVLFCCTIEENIHDCMKRPLITPSFSNYI